MAKDRKWFVGGDVSDTETSDEIKEIVVSKYTDMSPLGKWEPEPSSIPSGLTGI